MSKVSRRKFVKLGAAAVGAAVVAGAGYSAYQSVKPKEGLNITPDDARAIASDAYIYGFPMVDNYRILYAYCVDPNNPQHKAPWNQIQSTARVFTPEDKTVQTPNSDTPYSMLGMDLRAESRVLTVPVVEKSRYFSVQLNQN